MIEFILFGAVIAVILLLLFLRTNAGLIFLSLCGGNTLLQFADKNLNYVNTQLENNNLTNRFTVSNTTLKLILVIAPVVIVFVLSKHDQGKSKWPIQFLPALATGILGCLILIPLLSSSIQNSIANNYFWNQIQKYQIPVVAVGLLVSLIVVILTPRSSHQKSHHKSKE